MRTTDYPSQRWASPPKTLSAAVKRIEVLSQDIYWLNDETKGLRAWGEENAHECRRLERLLTYRAKVGDPIAICQHKTTEAGKITGNLYCSDCQEILVDNTQKPQS